MDWKNTEFIPFAIKSSRDEEDLAYHDKNLRYLPKCQYNYCWTFDGNLYIRESINSPWKRKLIGIQEIIPYEIGSWKN